MTPESPRPDRAWALKNIPGLARYAKQVEQRDKEQEKNQAKFKEKKDG